MHEKICWVLGDQVSDIKDGDEQAEFLSGKLCFFDDAICGCLGDSILVDELQPVYQKHDNDQPKIDLAQHAFLLFFCIWLIVGVEDLESIVAIRDVVVDLFVQMFFGVKGLRLL